MGQQVSLLSLAGRLIVSYTGYARHVALVQQGARSGAAKLWYDTPRKQFYLLVSLDVAVADPTPQTQQRVVGVDVGQRYLAVALTAPVTSDLVRAAALAHVWAGVRIRASPEAERHSCSIPRFHPEAGNRA